MLNNSDVPAIADEAHVRVGLFITRDLYCSDECIYHSRLASFRVLYV